MTELTVSGRVATTPRFIELINGEKLFSFRLEVPAKFTNPSDSETYARTNLYTITVFNELAINAKESISKGDMITATGNLILKEWSNDQGSGTTIEIVATTMGHDLNCGTSVFTSTQKI